MAAGRKGSSIVDVRDAALVSPIPGEACLLRPWGLADHQSSLGVNAHAIGASALFRTIAGACITALSVCRGLRSSVDEIVVAIAFTAVFHPGHAVAETSAGCNAFLHRQGRVVSLPLAQNAAIEVVDVAALVRPS